MKKYYTYTFAIALVFFVAGSVSAQQQWGILLDSDDERLTDKNHEMQIDVLSNSATEENKVEPVHMDLKGKTSDDETTAADVFIKIEGIDGESKDVDDDNDGVSDILDPSNDNTAVKPSKPKEIVVVGSKVRAAVQSGAKVRGWDPEKKEVIIGTSDINTNEDLSDYTNALTVSDDNIIEINLDDEEVELAYKHPVKLFGFISIGMPVRAKVNTSGKVNVRFPWYKFLTRNNVDDLQIQMEEAVQAMNKAELINAITSDNSTEAMGDDAQLANIDLQNALQKQQQTLQTMSNVMKTLHDTAMSVIRKIGG